MKTPPVYIMVVTTSERIMPRGIFLSGFFISSATLATCVSPRYETNTKPAVEKIPVSPLVANGDSRSDTRVWVSICNISLNPSTRNRIREATRNSTRNSCNPDVFLAPRILITIKTAVRTMATVLMGISKKAVV